MNGFFPPSELRMVKAPVSLVPKCGSCGLSKTCKRPFMKPSGKGRRKILVIGEYFSKQEDEQGIHFVGDEGERLEKAMSKCGVSLRQDCWLTNAIICRPAKGTLPNEQIVDYCRPTLIKTLNELDPEIIIPLGGRAVKSLLGHIWKEDFEGIERWVGFRIPSHKPNAWVAPNFSPAYVHFCETAKKPKPHVGVLFDRYMKDALALSGRPWEQIPKYESRLRPCINVADAAVLIRKLTRQVSIPQALDYETNMLKPYGADAAIVAAAISDGDISVSFPWHGEAREAAHEWIKSNVPKIASNVPFEENWTWKEFGHGVTNWDLDTMQTAHVADNRPGICSIKFQAFALLGVPSWNDHIELFLEAPGTSVPNRIRDVSITDLLKYVALDALYEVEVSKWQKDLYGLQTRKVS